MLHESRRTPLQASSQASAYFEKTLELLNAHGTTPVIVLMPIHPRVLRVMQLHRMGGEREQLREYLAGLTETYDIEVVDFTRIQSFNGEPGCFYDGVHITWRNANRVITALRAKAGEYLKYGAARRHPVYSILTLRTDPRGDPHARTERPPEATPAPRRRARRRDPRPQLPAPRGAGCRRSHGRLPRAGAYRAEGRARRHPLLRRALHGRDRLHPLVAEDRVDARQTRRLSG